MENDTTSINDLVTKHAEEIKLQNENNGGQSSQQQGGGSNEDDAAKAALKLQEEQDAAKLEAEKNKQQPDKLAELLKELQLDSIDSLKEKLKGKNEERKLTKEEQEKADAVYEADLIKFGVESGDMKLDDFTQLKTVKSKADAEFVFEKYLDNWKEENPDEVEDIEGKAKTDFEAEYKLNSSSEKAKERGIAKLARDAKDLRSPLESSFEKVKGKFDSERELRKDFPVFAKKIEDTVSGLVPAKVEWFKDKDGDDEISIDIELTPDEKKEINDAVLKKINTPQTFLLYKEGKNDEIKELTKDLIENLAEKKVRERANKEIATKFFGRGVAKGSTTGAENSFATNQSKQTAHEKQSLSKQEAEATVLKQFGKK